jgi:hypothetical protein
MANMAALLGRMAAHSGLYVTWDEAIKSNFEYVKNIDQMTLETEAPIHAGPDGIYPAPEPGRTKEH